MRGGARAGYQVTDAMALIRIEIDEELCDGCGVCVPACSQTALALAGGKARFVGPPACDGMERCLGACPRGALRVIAAAPPGPGGLPPDREPR